MNDIFKNYFTILNLIMTILKIIFHINTHIKNHFKFKDLNISLLKIKKRITWKYKLRFYHLYFKVNQLNRLMFMYCQYSIFAMNLVINFKNNTHEIYYPINRMKNFFKFI